ncbi:MAG: M1 family metallopeptidase [Saprospiraceae bacterium]|nr:M1 family metallopeptidase [Saprospiraceae bacterium]MBK9631736.1 M1 family metallopeptidase [Saprospiraceae bacterium]
MMFRNIIIFFCIFFKFDVQQISAQAFSLSDSLRGSMRKEREYDVKHYDLRVKIDVDKKSISGSNEMAIQALTDLSEIQIDLFENLKVLKITRNKKDLKFRRLHQAIFVQCNLANKEEAKIKVEYEGIPIAAKNAPWDGGFVWSKDKKNKPWVGVACEGVGASLWWPNKDHLSDEPDSMDIRITVPKTMKAISNGLLTSTEPAGKFQTFHYHVSYSINNYNVTFYAGDYVSFQEQHTYPGGAKLTLNYHILEGNQDKAKAHFAQVPKVLNAFNHYLGPYPFLRDGYALVEAPYVGMEHQSAIAYGNGYQNGYFGRKTPENFDYDYVILHETGHEYFGNSVSCKDHAEMWIHESFTTYLENLFVEFYHGKKAGLEYLQEQRKMIKNDRAILGPKEVNFQDHSTDIYYKGAWVLQTLRHSINNDSLWFDILKEFYNQHKYGFAETKDFIQLVNAKTKKDYTVFFRQYLIFKAVPRLVYSVTQRDQFTQIKYKWECDEPDFDLPVEFILDGRKIRLDPEMDWKNIEFSKLFNKVEPNTSTILVDAIKRKE